MNEQVIIAISKNLVKESGKKKKDFNILSSLGRRIKTKPLKEHSSDKLRYATQMNLRKEGRTIAAFVVKQVMRVLMNKCIEESEQFFRLYDADKVLALMIKLSSSRYGYQYLGEVIESGANLHPSF